MFDSTPLKSPPAPGRNEFMNEVLLGRLSKLRATSDQAPQTPGIFAPPPASEKIMDLLAIWNGNINALRDSIELAADWGPFELVGCWPAYYGADKNRRVICRFIYHGGSQADAQGANARGQFEYCLRDSLNQITKWEEIAA
ncbi:MAG: hypothetical protein HKN14_11710 [Marinicaulis sp.]|nr:hypothetical protein [Marinicaulis sp.]